MGLLIIKGRDGKPRPTWYGRISVKGKRRDANLGVPIEGTIPVSDQGAPVWTVKGDTAFERSKRAAQKAFEKWRKETQKRTYTPTADWCAAVRKWFERFGTFARKYAAEHGALCETINDITPELVAAWFNTIKKQFTWETVSKQMSLMRGAFARYGTTGKPNPFSDVVMRNRETDNARVNRKPLTAAEAQRLVDCARDNDNLYPLIVCAACTTFLSSPLTLFRNCSANDRKIGPQLTAFRISGGVASMPLFKRQSE